MYKVKVEARSFDGDLLEKWEATEQTEFEALLVAHIFLCYATGKHDAFQTLLCITNKEPITILKD